MSARSLGLAVRSAATAPVVSVFVVVVIALVAFVGAATPALLHDARTATVQAALDRMSPVARDLSGSTRGVPATGAGTSAAAAKLDPELSAWGRAIDAIDTARSDASAPLRDVLDDPRIVVVADPAMSTDPDAARPSNRVMLTLDPTYDSRVTFVEGSAPAQFASTTDSISYDVAISTAAADALDWQVGQSRTLSSPLGLAITATLVGIFEADDADDPDWSHVPTALRPGAVADPDGNITYYASAYVAPAALPTTQRQADSFAVDAWLPLAVERVDGGASSELAAQLRAATGVQVPLEVVLQNRWPQPITFTSTAPAALDAATARADGMAQIAVFVGVGPLALAIVVLALASRLLATRRVASARLVAARGASTRLLAITLATEGLVLGLVGAAIGTGVAVALWGFEGAASVLVPVLVTLTPVIVLPWLTLQLTRREGRGDLGEAPRGARLRRLALEAAIVVAAGAIVALAVTGPAGVDPALLVVPIALAAVASLAALRLVPLVLGRIERRTPATRGLVALIGPARGRRDPAVRSAPVLAVVLGLSAALFAVAFAATMSDGIQTAARVEAGADLRLDVPYLGADGLAEIRALDGVSAVAQVSDGARVELRAGDRIVRATVYATDTAELATVQAASGVETVPIPSGLATTDGTAMPAVISAALADALRGETLTLDDVPIDVAATAQSAARIGSAETWLLVDEAVAQELRVSAGGGGTIFIALDDGADAAAVATEVTAIAGPDARITTPATTAERLSSDPALIAVVVALIAAGVIVVLLLVLAIGMTLVLGAPSRARLLALLAALGYPRRRDVPFVWWEVAPALLLALPFGVAVGIVLPLVTIPRLTLSVFLADALEPAVRLGGWMPVAVVAGFIVITALAVLIAAAAASRFTAASAVRTADEEG